MDAKYFNEIEAREQAATPGPWYEEGWALPDEDTGEFTELGSTDPDAIFIAHARTDVPNLTVALREALDENAKLIAEVERLSDALTDQTARANICEHDAKVWREDRDKLFLAHSVLSRTLKNIFSDFGRYFPRDMDYYIQQAQEQEGKE